MQKLAPNMILKSSIKYLFVGVAMWCTALHCAALTIGQARAAVLVGQALHMTVPIRAESPEDAAALCFEAEVFYADRKQDARSVSVHYEFSAASMAGSVQVVADAVVDEPVVTVYLRSGCQQKSTRRFVMLADVASGIAQPNLEDRARLPAPVSVPPPPSRLAPAPSDAEAGQAAMRTKTKAPTRLQPTPDVASPPAVKPLAQRRAQLKLSPVDLTVDHGPLLKPSVDMQIGDAEDLQKRAQALALWRALNASPDEILSAQGRKHALEADLSGLRTLTAKNQQTLQELTGRLRAAESERYFNPLVYALVALLVVCSAAAIYVWKWMRQNDESVAPWWGGDEGEAHAPQGTFASSAASESSASVPAQTTDASRPLPSEVDAAPAGMQGASILSPSGEEISGSVQADVPHVPPEASAPGRAPDIGVSRAAGHADFMHSVSASLRALNSQEMLDVRQQAEFFMTLGQHEEAIGLLKDSLDNSEDSNPLVYLDLLKVLHTLGRKLEFDQYRMDFNAVFSGRVPPYAEFMHGGDGLEAYPDVCRAICAHWPTHEAVEFMESCMVRTKDPSAPPQFELEAFRDLLLLHSIAQRVGSESDTGMQPFSAIRTVVDAQRIEPSARGFKWGAGATQPIVAVSESEGMTSVDLDLSEPAAGNLIDFDTADLALPKPQNRTPR